MKRLYTLSIISVLLVLCIATLALALTAVEFNTPTDNANVSGTFNLSVSTTGDAFNVTYMFMQEGTSVLNLTVDNTSSSTSFNISIDSVALELTDGMYNITSNATNSTEWFNVTIYNVTIDNTAPIVTILLPTDDSSFSSQNFTISVSVTDALLDIDTVYFTISNQSAPFNITDADPSWIQVGDFWNVTVNASTLAEGSHNITVFANDTVGNANTSALVSIIVDRTGPVVNFTAPQSNQYYNATTGNVTFSLTATDALLSVDLVQFNISNATAIILDPVNAGDSWSVSYNVSSLDDGAYTITAQTNDTAGNRNDAVYLNFTVDTTAPIVAIMSADATHNSTPTVSFNFTDALSAMANCVVTLDDGDNDSSTLSNSSTLNATQTNVTFESLSDNVYNLTVSCTDLSTNVGTNDTTTLTVNQPSFISAFTQGNSSWQNTNFSLNITTGGNPNTVQWRIENITNASHVFVNYTNMTNTTISLWNGTVDISNTTLLPDGNYTLRFNLTDLDNDGAIRSVNTSYVLYLDRTNPSITSFSCNNVNVGQGAGCSCSAADNSESFGGSVSTAITGSSTASAGSKTATCTATDEAGNTATTTASFTVTATSSGGSGGGSFTGGSAPSQPQTVVVTTSTPATMLAEVSTPKTLSLVGSTHTVQITTITATSVTLRFDSTPVFVTLGKGQEQVVLVDDVELLVRVNDIFPVSQRADITLQVLSTGNSQGSSVDNTNVPVAPTPQPPTVQEPVVVDDEPVQAPMQEPRSLAWLWIVLIVIVVAGAAYFFIHKK